MQPQRAEVDNKRNAAIAPDAEQEEEEEVEVEVEDPRTTATRAAAQMILLTSQEPLEAVDNVFTDAYARDDEARSMSSFNFYTRRAPALERSFHRVINGDHLTYNSFGAVNITDRRVNKRKHTFLLYLLF